MRLTAQEQDDAKAVLGRVEGAWYFQHHFLLWDWVGFLYGAFLTVLVGASVIGLAVCWDD